MKKKILPEVYCIYMESGKSFSEILEESFRIYLKYLMVNSETSWNHICDQ